MNSAPKATNRKQLAQQCVKCGLCLPHCPTYQLERQEAESPRGRIALMAALAEDTAPAGALPSLDHCLGCRRCEAVCPADVAYESLLLQTRAARPPQLGWREKTALWLMAHKPLLNGSLSAYRLSFPLLPTAWRVLPRPEQSISTPQNSARNAVFSGCVADRYEQSARVALLKLLAAIGEHATIAESQVCCGQAARHAGQSRQAETLAKRNQQAFAGYARVLVLASGCQGALADSLGDLPVVGALQFLAERAGKLNFASAHGRHVALHIPCTAAFHGEAKATQLLLQRIPDLHLTVLPNSGCCGAAGLQQLAEPTRAAHLRAPVLAAVPDDAELLLSANIGCRLHLGQVKNAMHPIEFMADYLS
jgi:glycolate oxidase iron-sulfur subunit